MGKKREMMVEVLSPPFLSCGQEMLFLSIVYVKTGDEENAILFKKKLQ